MPRRTSTALGRIFALEVKVFDQKAYLREYYQRNKETIKARSKRWAASNPARRTEIQAEYTARNLKAHCAKANKRRAAKLHATIPGFDAEIKAIYLACPDGHHVDHIVPLQGKNVCGLHVPWNLQYLPAAENLSKGNSHTPF